MELWALALLFALCGVAVLMKMKYTYLDRFGGFWSVAAILSVAAAMAEDSSIVLYEKYSYESSWGLFVHNVPLHVVLIWPLFILGEYHYLRTGLRLTVQADAPLAGLTMRGLFCFVDTTLLAYLIEVFCVKAGLWSWRFTNCLGVPFLGAAGWGMFSTPAVVMLSAFEVLHSKSGGFRPAILLVVPVSLTTLHLCLVGAWHLLAFRHFGDSQVSPGTTALVILAVQALYQMAVVASPYKPTMLLSEELPRLLACSVVASLWIFKGGIDLGTCLVSAASLVRVLTFKLA